MARSDDTLVTYWLHRGRMEISTPGTDGTDSEMLCAKLCDGISISR